MRKWVGERPAYNSNGRTFPSDNEGLQLWPSIAQKVDTVNIMAYDAANISFDFAQVVRVRVRVRVRVGLGLGLG